MSTPTDEEARGLAARWAAWRAWAQRKRAQGDLDAEYEGPWDPHEEGGDCERLYAWVHTKVASIMRECAWAPGRRDDHITARVYLSLWPHTPKTEGLATARAILDAAKAWPS